MQMQNIWRDSNKLTEVQTEKYVTRIYTKITTNLFAFDWWCTRIMAAPCNGLFAETMRSTLHFRRKSPMKLMLRLFGLFQLIEVCVVGTVKRVFSDRKHTFRAIYHGIVWNDGIHSNMSGNGMKNHQTKCHLYVWINYPNEFSSYERIVEHNIPAQFSWTTPKS